ncbi:EamA family transporter [Microvirga flavescens]|uniref:EamA family transporter n=1 Tax=Microvirga flavescens TaxID=2249811 RepID=UPI000DD59C3C|nr:EamA family transporter [Microvirga flavescens]
MPLAHVLLALVVTLIWGFNFIVVKVGVGTVPPLLLCGLRFLFAALPTVFFLPRPQTDWRIVGSYGFVLGVVKFGLLFTAIAIGMPAGLASLVLQAQAFFTILFAAVLLREKPGPHQILGGLVACLGLILIAWPRLTGSDVLPFLLTVAAAAAWGVANIISKRAGRIDMLAFVVWASLIPPIPLFALSFWLEGWERIAPALTHMDVTAIGAVAYLAYPTTIVGFGIWGFLLSRHSAATVAPFSLLVPITGIACASLILGERMLPVEILGGAVIVSGLAINTFGGRALQRLKPA